MSDIIKQLKRYKPSSLKASLRDGTERPVAVPKSGNRWSRCEQVLDALDWQNIECLDKDGRVLGVIEHEEDDIEDFADEGEGSITLVKLAHIMLDVQRSTMKEVRQMFEVQLRGQAELVQSLIDSTRAIGDSYSLAMKVQAAHAVSESGEGDPEIMNMLKMAMMYQMQSKPAASLPRSNPMPPQQPQTNLPGVKP
jgi:hypothetical protein